MNLGPGGKEGPVHFHTPFHPGRMSVTHELGNLILILLGLLLALFVGPIHLD
jgi:hypothetical protein